MVNGGCTGEVGVLKNPSEFCFSKTLLKTALTEKDSVVFFRHAFSSWSQKSHTRLTFYKKQM